MGWLAQRWIDALKSWFGTGRHVFGGLMAAVRRQAHEVMRHVRHFRLKPAQGLMQSALTVPSSIITAEFARS